jgi:UDP-N-acetyl-D-glucosamine dehydrogenase
MQSLLSKIRDQSAKIGIIGQGYVGLPLAMAFAKKFTVFGYDVCSDMVKLLLAGKSHIQDVTHEQLSRYIKLTYFPTSNPEDLRRCDFLIICVPTPLTEDKIPDLSYIKIFLN